MVPVDEEVIVPVHVEPLGSEVQVQNHDLPIILICWASYFLLATFD